MTRKQREKIYREAAYRIFFIDSFGCCAAVERCSNAQANIENFPELFLFEYACDGYIFWWQAYNCDSKECRIIALLLSAEMTKTENLK